MRQAIIFITLIALWQSLWAASPALLHEGFNNPWALLEVQSKQWLVTEKSGRLVLFDELNKPRKPLLTLDVDSQGQGGLLDIAKAHDFKKTGRLLLSLVVKSENAQATVALAEVFYKNGQLQQYKKLWQANAFSNKAKHFGSRILVDDNSIWLTIGDRGARDNAQSLTNHAGKVLRFTLDGKAHPDNPFYTHKQALPEIYSFGHRNPQGIAAVKGEVFVSEHGPRGGDEINQLCAGCNFGWPEVSKGQEYWGPISVGEPHKKGMVDAKKVYVPSIAPSGLLYLPQAIGEIPQGFLLPALKLQHINYVSEDFQQEQRFFHDLKQRVRALALNADNTALYFVTDAGNFYRYPQ